MRVLFCGGGTAGHIYPNLAIAETIKENVPNCKLAYVVTENGMENSLVNCKKYSIDVTGLKKLSLLHNIRSASKMIKAQRECKKIIREFRPDIIVGTGGYATFPVVYSGYKMGIKTVLHESNVIPGKTIKLLVKYATKIFINFEETLKYLKNKDKVLRVGNPLRKGYEVYEKEIIKRQLGINEQKVIVCFGGSLGASKINRASIELIKNYIQFEKNIRFIWATGRKEYFEIKKKLSSEGILNLKNVDVQEFIHNMPEVIACADVVISRAGAVTLSELSASKKCSILIPSPNVSNNHQYKNAKTIVDKNGALLITENNIYMLTDTVKELINDDKKRKELEENISKFHLKSTNKLIFNEIVKILNYK